jgi:hypothetical protein
MVSEAFSFLNHDDSWFLFENFILQKPMFGFSIQASYVPRYYLHERCWGGGGGGIGGNLSIIKALRLELTRISPSSCTHYLFLPHPHFFSSHKDLELSLEERYLTPNEETQEFLPCNIGFAMDSISEQGVLQNMNLLFRNRVGVLEFIGNNY